MKRLFSLLATTALLGFIAAPADATYSNIVTNGDFSAGNTGFSSNYTYITSFLDLSTYTVGTNPHIFHGGGASYSDHTTGDGLMLIVNGSVDPTLIVWSDTLNVNPDTDYTLSFWFASWGSYFPDKTTVAPSVLQVKINGIEVASNIITPSTVGVWDNHVLTWNSGASSLAEVSFYDINVLFSGNDFSLDDISFTKSLDISVPTPAPEPSTLLLLGGGLVGLAVMRKRKSKKQG